MKKIFKFLIGFGISLNSFAANQDEWFVVPDEKTGDHIAAVIADNGEDILGYRCFRKEQLCTIVIRSKVQCEDEASYPMLVNSPEGSFMLDGICSVSSSKNYDQILTPYNRISEVMFKGEGILGIAIAMKNGEFKAIRFNLKGATKKMLEAWQKTKKLGNSKNSDTF